MTAAFLFAKTRVLEPREGRIMGIIYVMVGIVLLLISYLRYMGSERLKDSCTESVSAMVVSTEERRVGKKLNVHNEFRAVLALPSEMGVPENTAVTPWSDMQFYANERITVKYDPSDPGRIYIPSNPPHDGRKLDVQLYTGLIVVGILLYIVYRNG